MILQCPQCDTQFKLDKKILRPEGRKMRCSSCGHIWNQPEKGGAIVGESPRSASQDTAEPETPESFSQALKDSLNEIDDTQTEYAEKPLGLFTRLKIKASVFIASMRRTMSGDLSWMVNGLSATFGLAVIIAACTGIFISARETIVLHAPSLYNTYQRLGYEVVAPGQDLVLENTAVEWGFDAKGEPVLKIKGNVTNTAKSRRHVPPLRATLILKSGQKGDSRLIELENPIIEPEAKREFETTIPDWRDPEISQKSNIFLSFAIEKLHTSGH